MMLPYRSLTTSGILSVILPDDGQLYVGRTTDAIPLALSTQFFLGAHEAGKSGSGMLFSLIGLAEMGWYDGNVFNAINRAFFRNR